jgi:cell division control protein 6
MRSMNLAAYLRKASERAEQRSELVKDYTIFDFNYIPDEPLLREEAKRVIDAIVRFNVTGIPTHQAIIGSRGSGKTLTLKYLQRIIPAETSLRMVYANCRHHNTSFKLLAHLLGDRTAGSSLSDLYQRFLAANPQKTVVALDEIDLMSPKDRHREILYLLSRSERPFMVIMLSNSPHILKQLDAATRSSLQPELVHFRNYDAEQIQQILEQRACRGLVRWERAELAHIAGLTTSQTNADARVAIKTLYYVVSGADRDVPSSFEKARRDIVVDVVNDLTDPNLRILWAVATSESDLAKGIYQRYCRFSQTHQEKPYSYVHFYANLSYLQSVGLVGLVSTKVDRTYTNRILLTIDRAIVDSICRLRFAAGGGG